MRLSRSSCRDGGKPGELVGKRREGASVRREETSKLKVEETQKFFIGTSDNRVFIL